MIASLWVLLSCAAWGEQPQLHLIFGGDVMLGRRVYVAASVKNDFAYPFRGVAGEFAGADIAFVNLESPFAAGPPYTEERMVFRAHPSMVEGLKVAGIDVVSTANNHSRDGGDPGLRFTLEVLGRNGIAAVGTALDARQLGQGVVVERKGLKVGFLAYTFDQRNGNHLDTDARIAMLHTGVMAGEIRELRKRVDVVVVSMHAGFEYQNKPNSQQMTVARAAIDAGATVVVGHHPHVTQPVERYKGGVIFYSLGNLVFDQDPRPDEGAVGDVFLRGGAVESWRVRKIRIVNGAPQFRGD